MARTRLPVITAFGGYNAAGRSSFHHGYRRMVLESLPGPVAGETIVGLATLMGLVTEEGGRYKDGQGRTLDATQVAAEFGPVVTKGTLIRRIEEALFDPSAVLWQKNAEIRAEEGKTISFVTRRRDLPEPLPSSWQVEELAGGEVRVVVQGSFEAKVDSFRELEVQAAGQLPSGFLPGEHYPSRFHPRGLQMTVLGASDAIHSLGIAWNKVVDRVRPDEIAVYANSMLTQMDEYGNRGLVQARMRGGRASSKQLAMGLNSMPGDFVNAYILGSVGVTGSAVGACATFLYNLRLGIEDIQSGRRRVAFIGGAEAPVVPEFIDGFNAMSALANDANLRRLDGTDEVDHRRASRPFGQNCGFVLGESSQFVLLMDDELAMELGADIYGAVPNVYVNADGFKKSISAPGPGNYITLAKAVGSARAILGDEAIQKYSFVQAHGSSTPANRVTESLIFDQVARAFDIHEWPVAAVKAYVGHSIAPASADQLAATLGIYQYGLLPGIKTIDSVADDVHDERLLISKKDLDLAERKPQVTFLNSKGFGGNNATASVLAPTVVEKMLEKRYGKQAFSDYQARREAVREEAQRYDREATNGRLNAIYRFGEDMIDESAIAITDTSLSLPGFARPVSLEEKNAYEDMV